MNSKEQKISMTLRRRVVIVTAAIHVIALACVTASLTCHFRGAGGEDMGQISERLESAVSKEELIVVSVMEFSKLAKESGYELAVDDIIRDHRRSIASIKEDLRSLRSGDDRARPSTLVPAILAILVLEGLLLIGCLFVLLGRLLAPMELMAEHIDDLMAGKRPGIDSGRIPKMFRGYYGKFVEFVRSVEAERVKASVRGADADLQRTAKGKRKK
ncbi:MAG: hypothetical protein JXA20_17265 [Spirochaetes bacterium]|nr:hypothetical protein [Spirochaetota bacterium]